MKKVAATSGHSRSLGFFFALSGAGAAGMNSWLLRAGVLANFDGFLLGLSHQMRCNRSIHRIENLWRKFCKKKRVLVWSWAVHVGAGFISPPRRRGRRENLLAAERARRLSFASVILSAAGRSACKSSGGVEEPLRCLALPPPLQG